MGRTPTKKHLLLCWGWSNSISICLVVISLEYLQCLHVLISTDWKCLTKSPCGSRPDPLPRRMWSGYLWLLSNCIIIIHNIAFITTVKIRMLICMFKNNTHGLQSRLSWKRLFFCKLEMSFLVNDLHYNYY